MCEWCILSSVTLLVSVCLELVRGAMKFDKSVDAILVSVEEIECVFADARFCDSKCRSRGCTIFSSNRNEIYIYIYTVLYKLSLL